MDILYHLWRPNLYLRMLEDFYHKRQQEFETQLTLHKKRDFGYSAFRLSLILGAGVAGYLYLADYWNGFLYLSLLLVVAFVAVLFRHLKLRRHIRQIRAHITINRNEQAYLRGDLSPFDGGSEWISGEHLFSNDLDLFGNHSLFQHLNRTVTLSGKMKLAQELSGDTRENIEAHQQAIQELSHKVDWRQQFAVSGMEFEENPRFRNILEVWLESSSKKSTLTTPYLLYPLAAITFGLGIYWFIDGTLQSFTWLSYAFGLNLALVFSHYKTIKKEYEHLNTISKSLSLYSELLNHIEGVEFESQVLVSLKDRLKSSSVRSSVALKKLSRLLDGFDQMNNVVALLFTNGFYHYHLHVLRGLFHWKKTHGPAIYEWLDVVAEFDRFNSKANYAYNHPGFNYPVVLTSPGFGARAMGHPMISTQKRIDNDLHFDGFKYVVLTGSNMSGKSTFLRTIGVNLVLMKMGLPVCAEKMESFPFRLLTSMKLVDSLDKDESYFQAEVIRLKRIQQVLQDNKPCMVLLDEILRGTNSDDKRTGTRLFMQRIGSYNALGVIATHDIDIADLASQQADVFDARYFESKVKDGELLFDYKLRKGICTTPNATDLMRAQGII